MIDVVLLRDFAIKTANNCPAGRLLVVGKDSNFLEQEQVEEVTILQDLSKNASAAIYVKGNMP